MFMLVLASVSENLPVCLRFLLLVAAYANFILFYVLYFRCWGSGVSWRVEFKEHLFCHFSFLFPSYIYFLFLFLMYIFNWHTAFQFEVPYCCSIFFFKFGWCIFACRIAYLFLECIYFFMGYGFP